MEIIESDVWVKVQFFCMRLCYSKASFVWPYRTAELESFLDGHVKEFEHFGCVPNRLAYDNLKSAVIQIKRGRERRLGASPGDGEAIREPHRTGVRSPGGDDARAELRPWTVRADARSASCTR